MLPEKFISTLKELLNEKFLLSKVDCEAYATTDFHFQGQCPGAICLPVNTEEVSLILKTCNTFKIPFVPYGAGTSVEGQVSALSKDILLIDLSGMKQVIEFSEDDLFIKIQPGITYEDLDQYFLDNDTSVFFPIDAWPAATLGGMVSTGASGTNAVKYGTMRENTLGLTIVSPNGDVIHTGGRAVKSSAGYDLTRLFVGAEGTLGVVTEIILKLQYRPSCTLTAYSQFDDINSAVESVVVLKKSGVSIGRMELMDKRQVEACILYTGNTQISVKETIFFECSGTELSVNAQLNAIQDICESSGGKVVVSSDEASSKKLWHFRKVAGKAALNLCPEKKGMVTDACVPITRLPECILLSQKKLEGLGLDGSIVGHVGDGNFHVTVLAGKEDWAAAKDFVAYVAKIAVSQGGTITGEHGIGVGKKALLPDEHASSIRIMQAIKHAIDPNNIANPGKIFDMPSEL